MLSFSTGVVFVVLVQSVNSYCPNHCSSHGVCFYSENIAGICLCDLQWDTPFAADCSLRSCPKGRSWSGHAKEGGNVHTPSECSNRGTCNRQIGVCLCDDGFEGKACERMSCPMDCNSHGKCVSIGDRATMLNYSYSLWDKNKIYGCVCDDGFEGYDCSQLSCPKGVPPGTNIVREVQALECTCEKCSGSLVLQILGFSIKFDPSDSESMVTNRIIEYTSLENVTIELLSGVTLCSANTTETRITFIDSLGSLATLEVIVNNLVSATNQAISVRAFQKGKITSTGFATVDGEASIVACSGRGICDNSIGRCACQLPFQSSKGKGNNEPGLVLDCGYEAGSLTECAKGVNDLSVLEECSGKGVCLYGYYCNCSTGYTGIACDKLSCPNGIAWFDNALENEVAHEVAMCSNRGHCNFGTGECICYEGFSGPACEKLDCPGNGICSSKGTCYSLGNLVLLSDTLYGELLGLSYDGWDKNSIYGCYCDRNFYLGPFAKSRSKYIGHDCSVLSCPYGHNTDVLKRSNEIQTLKCSSSNAFRLSFAQKESVEILGNDTITTLNKKLDALTVISGLITAKFISPLPIDTFICSWKLIELNFRLPGDLPLLVASPSTENISIKEFRKGNTHATECSSQGLCNRGTGECECFDGQQSGDGTFKTNSYGQAGDCSALNEFGFIV